MKLLTSATTALLLFAASPASAEVKVSIHDGRVTIVAKDVTVRQIIAEWARVGQAKVVNAERLPGGPTSLEVTDMPEGQALDLLLRSAAGYVAAPRPVAAADLSTFDRVIVLPTSSAPRATNTAPAPVFQQPQFAQPQPVDDDIDDDRPQPNVQMPAPNPRGPVFNTFPQQPQVVNPQTGAPVTGALPGGFQPGQIPPQQQGTQQPTTFSAPSAPFGGVAVPGMIAPAPQQQPGQIAPQPGQIAPPQPGQVRRPGGEQGGQ
jgi:hypothetical protein